MLWSVPSRLRIYINSQICTLLHPGQDKEVIANEAIENVCRDPQVTCFRTVSEEFRVQCARLLITQKKPVITKSIVNDLGSVFAGQMSESIFLRKYC